jgi:hypothetical protein
MVWKLVVIPIQIGMPYNNISLHIKLVVIPLQLGISYNRRDNSFNPTLVVITFKTGIRYNSLCRG